MCAIASQITSLTVVYSTVYSDADQIKHQSPASLALERGNHRGPVNSPHKWPVTRKMFPFDDVIMLMPDGLLPLHMQQSFTGAISPVLLKGYTQRSGNIIFRFYRTPPLCTHCSECMQCCTPDEISRTSVVHCFSILPLSRLAVHQNRSSTWNHNLLLSHRILDLQ